jgi:thiosulfate/3-mercaptopyruvate sulfurtransferase
MGHIPGPRGWSWEHQLGDEVKRDIIRKSDLERLLGNSDISNRTTVVVYGDNNNWFALKYLLGYPKVRNYDGPGRNGQSNRRSD